MLTNNKLSFLLALTAVLTLLLFSACKKDDEENEEAEEESFILEESVFGCTNYQAVDLELDDNISEVHYYEGHYFLATFDERLIVKEELDGEIIKEEAIDVYKFITYDSNLIICAKEGLFKVDELLNFELIIDKKCLDVEINPAGDLFVSLGYNDTYDHSIIYKVDLEQNELIPHTSGNSNGGLTDFVFLSTTEIWTVASYPYDLHRFQNGIFSESYTSEDLPFTVDSPWLYVLAYDGDLVLIAKNGPHQILKFKSEEWIVLKDFKSLDVPSVSDKDIYMGLASISDAIIYNDLLYVSTNFAGCRGIQRFDITKNELLQDGDYDVIQDPSLSTQCIQDLFIGSSGQILVSGQSSITSMDCN